MMWLERQLLAQEQIVPQPLTSRCRHAQALSQVDGYLRRMPHPEGVREAVSDTAGAAQMIADNGWRCPSVRCLQS